MYRYPSNGSEREDTASVYTPSKMLRPYLRTGVKQGHDAASIGVYGFRERTFSFIAQTA